MSYSGVAPECPTCGRALGSDDINVAKDVAYCSACGLAHSLSDMVHTSELVEGVNFRSPPRGVSYRNEGRDVIVTASHRSWVGAIGTLGFALFWNGIVSVFVAVAIAATLDLAGVHAPEWFPAPKMNGEDMSVGMTAFLWLFLSPFILVGLVMTVACLMCLMGKTVLRINGREGVVFTGIGVIGRRRRFQVADIARVELEEQVSRSSEGSQTKIHILLKTHDGGEIRVGSSLPAERRRFLGAALQQAIMR